MTLLNQSQFAKELGRHRSYVTELKSKGLLVMRAGLVDVEATKKLMEDMKDPSKQAVAERHEANRQAAASATATPPTDQIALSAGEKAGSVYQQSRALKEKYAAMTAKRDYEISTGKLIIAEEAAKIAANAAAVVRQRLDSLPDVLAPQFAAETDEQRIRATFYDQIESLLSEMHRQFKNLAKDLE